MGKFAVSDYLSADLGITRIARIYKSSTSYWSRSEKRKRDYEGLLYFVDGVIRYDLEGTVFEAHAGQVLRLPKNIAYNGKKLDSGVLTYYCIDFLTENEGEYDALPLPYAFTPSDGNEVENRFAALEHKWNDPLPAYAMECKRDILDLLGHLVKDQANSEYGYGERSRVLSMCEYISDNLHRAELSVKEIAMRFHLSETHLRRVFGAEMGVSPLEYLISLRIRRAKAFLISKRDKSIAEIGEECGYSSQYYFSASFRKETGVSPLEYRRSRGNNM